MESDGGGWTLLLKADGRAQTFAFDASIWTDETLIVPSPVDLSLTEAKLAGYSILRLVELRVDRRFARRAERHARGDLPARAADSLAAAIGAGFTPLDVTRDAWLALVPGSVLQDNCNLSGVDATGSDMTTARVRIGIVANNEDLCSTPDSFVGVGAGDAKADVASRSATGAFCR